MEKEEFLGKLMSYASHLSRMHLDEQLRSYEITPVQGHTLRFLAHQPQHSEVTHRDVEQSLRLKPSTINGVVERMEEKGLIVRTVSPSDGRCRIIRLTKKGLSLSLAIDEAVQNTERTIRSCLTKEEEDLLFTLLRRICDTIQNEVNYHA